MKYSIIILLLVSIATFGQDRVRPGQLYQSGQEVYGPRFGVKAVIPEGWVGVLPQGTQVFSLIPANTLGDNIIVYARKDNLEEIKKRWEAGVQITDQVKAELISPVEQTSNSIVADFRHTDDKKKIITGEAVCGEFGNCVIVFALTDEQGFENSKSGVKAFSSTVTFVPPGEADLYAGFDWVDWMTGKYLFNYESAQKYKKFNQVWLCDDGTFTSKLKRGGVIKGEIGVYKGKHKGTYTVSGVGSTGKLILNFEKLEPVELNLLIKEDRIYINGNQFFINRHQTCK